MKKDRATHKQREQGLCHLRVLRPYREDLCRPLIPTDQGSASATRIYQIKREHDICHPRNMGWCDSVSSYHMKTFATLIYYSKTWALVCRREKGGYPLTSTQSTLCARAQRLGRSQGCPRLCVDKSIFVP
jgi:hypothetical protein